METIRSRNDGIDRLAGMAAWIRENQGDNGEQMARLRRNLRKARQQELTPRQREMVRLYYDEGMTMPQIGELLGVETSTVTTRLARARRRLKERLGEDWQDE